MYEGIYIFIGLALAVLMYEIMMRSRVRLRSEQDLLFIILKNARYHCFSIIVTTGFLIFLKNFDSLINSPFFEVVVEIILIGLVTWTLLRVIKTVECHYSGKDNFHSFTTSVLGTVTKIFLMAIVGLMILDRLGVNISSILTVGGVGGIILGLASKDLFANFLGFVTIVLDRPFKIGDLISSKDKAIRGVVDKITWRTTKVITLEKQPMYIPNSVMSTIIIQNESDALARRIDETLKFEFTDYAILGDFTDKVKAFLSENELFDKRFSGSFDVTRIGSSIVEIRLIAYAKKVVKLSSLALKQKVLLDIFEIAKNLGLGSIYPETQVCIYGNLQAK